MGSVLKFCLRFLEAVNKADMRTVYGRNLHMIEEKLKGLCDSNITCDVRNIGSSWCYWTPSQAELMKIISARELLKVQQKELYIPGFDDTEVKEMFNHLCSF